MECFDNGVSSLTTEFFNCKAGTVQCLLRDVSFSMFAGGHPGVAKAIMSYLGLDLGPARSPFSQLSESVETGLREELDSIGFFTWR